MSRRLLGGSWLFGLRIRTLRRSPREICRPRLRKLRCFRMAHFLNTEEGTMRSTNGRCAAKNTFLTVDLTGDFVLLSDYTGKEVVE